VESNAADEMTDSRFNQSGDDSGGDHLVLTSLVEMKLFQELLLPPPPPPFLSY
jgi:hypothetical protein